MINVLKFNNKIKIIYIDFLIFYEKINKKNIINLVYAYKLIYAKRKLIYNYTNYLNFLKNINLIENK